MHTQHLWWGTSHAEAADADPRSPLKRHSFDTIIGSDIVYLREYVLGHGCCLRTATCELRDDGFFRVGCAAKMLSRAERWSFVYVGCAPKTFSLAER